MVNPIRRKLLKTGAAAAAVAATPSVLAQQNGSEGGGRFYQKGNVRIRYEETGSGFPLLLIPGGGLNGSTIAGIRAGNPDMIACQNVFAIARPQTLKDFINNDAGPYFDRFDLHHYVNMDRYPEYYALYRSASAGKPKPR